MKWKRRKDRHDFYKRHKIVSVNFLEHMYPKNVSEACNGNVEVRKLELVKKVKRTILIRFNNGNDFDFARILLRINIS